MLNTRAIVSPKSANHLYSRYPRQEYNIWRMLNNESDTIHISTSIASIYIYPCKYAVSSRLGLFISHVSNTPTPTSKYYCPLKQDNYLIIYFSEKMETTANHYFFGDAIVKVKLEKKVQK